MKDKIRVAVLVSGGGTNLQAIIDEEKKGNLPSVDLCAVISSNPEAYALERAKAAGIPSFVADRKKAGSREIFEKDIQRYLADSGAEVIVLAGFMYILSEGFIRSYPDRIINIHPALIPSFCGEGYYGLRVHEAALARGVKLTGATVHFVNEIPDGGRIIMQKAVEVSDDDTPETLQKKVMREAEWIIFPAALEKVCSDIQKGEKDG